MHRIGDILLVLSEIISEGRKQEHKSIGTKDVLKSQFAPSSDNCIAVTLNPKCSTSTIGV